MALKKAASRLTSERKLPRASATTAIGAIPFSSDVAPGQKSLERHIHRTLVKAIIFNSALVPLSYADIWGWFADCEAHADAALASQKAVPS